MRSGKSFIRIGSGSAAAEDRVDPAVELIEKGELDYICFDSLSEQELSNVAMYRLKNPEHKGYDLSLHKRMSRVLPAALKHKVKIIGNMGSGNPVAAAEYCRDAAEALGYKGIKIAAVTGDNVLEYLRDSETHRTVEQDKTIKEISEHLIAAHAYIPCTGIEEALASGADIVLTGRVGDSGMYLSILSYEYGWKSDDWDNLAKGICIGHLLECGGHLSGGFYADPPYKVVPNMHKLGFPYVEVHDNGDVFFSKVKNSGGLINVDICKEQMIYEVHDPENYIHPEVIADVSRVNFEQVGVDRVKLTGTIAGKPAPAQLKVNLGVFAGFYCAAIVWYAGPGAKTKAQLARDMLYARFDYLGYKPEQLRISIMGMDGLYLNAPGVPKDIEPWEVGVRVSARHYDKEELFYMMTETCANMSTNGPAGTNGEQPAWAPRESVHYYHTFIDRDVIDIKVTYLEV